MDDKVFIGWNVPNMITIPLMVAVMYLLVALIYQVAMGRGWISGGTQAGGYPGSALVFGNAMPAATAY